MTLYFENPVHFPESGTVTTNEIWHPTSALLAVASYSQDRGGFVTIFDELGEPLKDVTYPYHAVSQVTALAWHPEKHILATGWENGDLKVWNGANGFSSVNGPHSAPVNVVEFSEKGSRLVTCDSTGSLVGWTVGNRGEIVTAFHHDLKDTITHVTFRLTIKTSVEFDVEGLAKAAVNGDEKALDMFSNWRPKTTARKFRVQDNSDNTCFYVATYTGCIYYINQGGACVEVMNTEGNSLAYILFNPNSESLVVMMENFTIGHFRVDFQGHLSELIKVKMSGRSQGSRSTNQGLKWVGGSALAILTGDLTVRIWDVDSNDNFILPTTLKNYSGDEELSKQINETFTCIAYSSINQTICAGTNVGRIYFWLRNPKQQKEAEDGWELQNISGVSGTVKQLHWGAIQMRVPLLSVNCVTRVYIMKEQMVAAHFADRVWATQRGANEVFLETPDNVSSSLVSSSLMSFTLKSDIQVYDLSINHDLLAVTNGRIVTVYSLSRKKSLSAAKLASFSCENEKILLHEKDIVAMTLSGISVRSFSGAILSTIANNSIEGEPIGIDVNGHNLIVFTMDGYLKLYDLSGREPKLNVPVKNMYDMVDDFGEIIQAKSNFAGTRVAITLAASNLIPNGKLYVWSTENDSIAEYDFRKRVSFDTEAEEKSCFNLKTSFDRICSNRVPLTVFWDCEDSRLLCCTAKKLSITSNEQTLMEKHKKSKGTQLPLELEEQIIVTMFASEDKGLNVQDIRATHSESRLLGVATPFIATLQKLAIRRDLMTDFSGLDSCNKTTKEAVLDFSYHLSLGNMDEAFRAIKLVQSAGVWASLARMCVKTQRLDVAGVCLGHMGDARAAKLLRQAMNDRSLPVEAKLAVLAVHLGMLDEAEQLYVKCNRYDLLNKLHQSRNKMDGALQVAESKDRIHLRNTEHAWARVLEQEGNLRDAIHHYEKANTHRYDVPRILMDNYEQLQLYMSKTTDPELIKWWGQYVESQGDMSGALAIYAKADDIYSQVRVLCFLGDEGRAAELARGGNDKAAFYHMARHYETLGNVEEAVAFFTRANAYNNAVRLCKENGLSEELWNIGSVAGTREKLECARYFEDVGPLEKAIILYHRAGMLHKALDLAFKTHQFDTLQQIATELDADSDPALVKKCADYFIDNEQYDKAVDLLAVGKKYAEAIKVCLDRNVQLTDDLAEKLTPEKDEISDELRVAVLENLAESLVTQGNYHLATKKFTQAGDKVKAMKALLKSGDTDKIVFFAGVSRQREIYIMAANYLQSLDWQNQPEVLRNIITFYSKGKALDLLANFYVACAQVEIDEFQNYEKAYGALTEASRALDKIAQPSDNALHRRATEIVQQQLSAVKKFVDIKKLFERGDFQTAMAQSKHLLLNGGKELENSVRRGDVYALMIQMCIKHENFAEAKQLFLELRQNLSANTSNHVPITYYISKEILEELAKGLGVPVTALVPYLNKSAEKSVEQDEIAEEVEE